MLNRAGALAFVVAAVVLCLSATLTAQSLAEIAKKEEARRKRIATPSKVYTNDDLKKESEGQPQQSKPGETEKADEGTSTGPEKLSGSATVTSKADQAGAPQKPDQAGASKKTDQGSSPPKDESYWRGRMTQLRTQLSRDQMFQEALQTRVSVLTTDLIARDDPAQKNVIGADRQKAVDELARVKAEVKQLTDDIAKAEEEARRANVPPGWLR